MTLENAADAIPPSSFGNTVIVNPELQHTHTAILLHGRGSSGEEFAEELFEIKLSGGATLPEKLPNWKWIFPSSKELWSTAFEEEMPAWFEAHSLTDVTARQDLQVPGIADSVKYLNSIIEKEIEKLEGKPERVTIIGISQGAAIGLWTLLCSKSPSRRIGAFVGASTWLPFADALKRHLGQDATGQKEEATTIEVKESDTFVKAMVSPLRDVLTTQGARDSVLETPISLGHGTDDAYVDIELGRQARDVLASIGLKVEWKEYEGAEQEGHWLKEPEEIEDIIGFLQERLSINL